MKPSTLHRVTLLLILLVGAGLRWHALTQEVRFHPDEALFATFARNAAVYGDWMLPGALDKPPLSLYAAALSMQFVGVTVNERGVLDLDLRQGEFAARLPGTLAGMVLMALVYVLGCRLSSPTGGLFAAALAAGSPWLVAFSATAFTDPLMLTALAAALVMAARGRPAWVGRLSGGWGGIWLALAFWCKQQAVFYLPLVLWVVVSTEQQESTTEAQGRGTVLSLMHFAVTFAAGVLLLFLWDAARAAAQGTNSLFALAAANNNPERIVVTVAELLPRLRIWHGYAASWFGSTGFTLPVLLLSGIAVIIPSKGNRLRWALLIYALAFLAAHVVFAFNTYDRYLLPLIPLIAALAGAGLADLIKVGSFRLRSGKGLNHRGTQGTEKALHRFPVYAALIGVGLLILPVLTGGTSPRLPVDSRAYDRELLTLAAYLNAKPLGAILYNHWLGWELSYYLGAWSDKRQVYYPEPLTQAQDALLNSDPAPRYLITPRDVDAVPWLDAFRAAKFGITLEYSSRFIVYRLLPPFSDLVCQPLDAVPGTMRHELSAAPSTGCD